MVNAADPEVAVLGMRVNVCAGGDVLSKVCGTVSKQLARVGG